MTSTMAILIINNLTITIKMIITEAMIRNRVMIIIREPVITTIMVGAIITNTISRTIKKVKVSNMGSMRAITTTMTTKLTRMIKLKLFMIRTMHRERQRTSLGAIRHRRRAIRHTLSR